MNLSEKLSKFASSDIIDAEIIEETVDNSISIDNYVSYDSEAVIYEDRPKRGKKKKKKSSNIFDDPFLTGIEPEGITARTRRLAEMADLVRADEFDAFINDEDLFGIEENAEFRNELLIEGRKYARDNAASKEMSEINKTFADSEKKLKNLYDEIERDKVEVQKDIERMRLPRASTSKSLSEMRSVKTALHNAQLQIVKESNAMKKAMADMRSKEAAKKEAEVGNNDINANTLQSILSSARSSIMGSMGGYSNISGAYEESPIEHISSREVDDDELVKKYCNNDSSDGDLFLKYEGLGVEYVLLVDENGVAQEIIAEDKDGNYVPDYPLPSNFDMLSFDIANTGNMATDSLHRRYKVRQV